MNPSIQAAQVLPARAVLFLGIAGFHALLAYAFASGLIKWTVDVIKPDPPMEYIDVEKRVETPPPVPSVPQLVPTQYTATIVEPTSLPPINTEVDSPTAYEPPVTIGTPLSEPPAPLPIRLVGRNVMPNTADYYPPSEIRFGYEGTTEIRSCVNAGGRLDGSPVVETSSGRPSLDKAAVRLAQDGKYARAMRGDTPVPNCYRFRVTFTLH